MTFEKRIQLFNKIAKDYNLNYNFTPPSLPEKIKIDFDYNWPGPNIVKKEVNHLPDELFEI